MARNEVPKSIHASLYIDGKPAQNSIKNVEQVTRNLRKELNGLTIGTAEWNAKMRELKHAQSTLSGIRKEINGVGGAFGWLKTELGKLGTLAVGYLGFQFVTSQFQNIISQNAKLSDSLADIRRVAGLTEDEVRKLDKSFGELDTRTSKAGLREIAQVAGRLGVAKDDILGFVEATDMLVVALGDELGNADQITTQLGKILNVFDGEVNGDNITRLGNAMVKLANDGVASAGFISDFAQRVSGMAKTAGMGLGATLGLAAGIEELGGRSESGATAIQNLLVSIGQDIPKAAKIAGMEVQEFNQLFGATPELALLKYAEGLTQNKAAFSEVAGAFKDAGEEGVRVIETITKLGERADFMRSKFEDGTTALQGYNEIQDAFALKNETLGANVDKLSKTLNRLATNRTVTEFFIDLVNFAIRATEWIDKNSQSIANFAKIMTTAVVAWTAYNLAVKISTATLISARTATISAALAKAILTGNVTKAMQAMRLLNIVIKANPIGLLVSVLAAAATAFVLFRDTATDAEKAQRSLNDILLDAEKSIVNERLAIERAQKALQDDKTARENKLKAVNDLREIMPNVLRNYSDEEIMAGKATVAIRKHTDALLEQALIRKQADRYAEIEMAKMDNRAKRSTGKYGDGIFDVIGNEIVGGLKGQKAGQPYIDQLDKEFARMVAEQEALEEAMGGKKLGLTNPFPFNGQGSGLFDPKVSTQGNELTIPGSTVIPDFVATPDDGKKKKEKVDQVKKDQEQLREILQKNLNDIYIDSLDGAEKELAQLDAKYDEMRKKAHGNATLLKQIDDQYNADFINLLKKTTKVTEEEAEKRAIAEAEAFEKIELAGMSEREREIRQMEDHYAELIRLAEEYGFDASLVKRNQAEADRKMREQWAKEDRERDEQEAIEDREKKYQWAVDSAKLVADTVFSIGENRRDAELQSTLSQIEKERDAALANKNLTEEQKRKINEDFDKKAKAEKQKAFKADQKAAIAQAIINGLVGAGQLWIKPGFPAAIPLAAMLAAQTAANVAVIASQKAPEYAVGGPTDRDPAGYVSKATLFNKSASGRPFVAGERGREWIAPNWMLNTPQFADIIGMLETARQEKRFFAGGGSTQSNGGSGGSAYDFRRLEGMMATLIQEQKQANRRTPPIVYKDFEDFRQRIDYTRALQGKHD